MRTEYGRREQRRGSHSQRRGEAANSKDGLRSAQLLVCLVLFLVVFVGKGVLPGGLSRTGDQLLEVLRANTDFRAAFLRLGQALSDQDSVLGELGEFCVAVFGPVRDEPEQTLPPFPETLLHAPLGSGGDQVRMVQRYLGPDALPVGWTWTPPEPAAPEEPGEEPGEALEVGAVLRYGQDQGEALPEHYTRDWIYLGELETVEPVSGSVTSGFGYRNHPTKGVYGVHGGVDIAAALGTPVAAYAGGVVDYIGENDDFGLYLQIIHDNGVKTFYGHCSQLCVQKGQQVRAGETVALVGDTGQATGPHLHFEIKWNGLRLDPQYYLGGSGVA